jgi:hypothetical protein
MVALAVRVRTSRGVLENVADEAIGVASHLQSLAVRQLAFETNKLAVAMREAQQLARRQPINLMAKLRQITQ